MFVCFFPLTTILNFSLLIYLTLQARHAQCQAWEPFSYGSQFFNLTSYHVYIYIFLSSAQTKPKFMLMSVNKCIYHDVLVLYE